VANARTHATTGRVVQEAFAEERPALRPLPLAPYRAVLKLERRVSHEGMVSVGGSLYSVPDTTRRRILDVHVLADEVRLFEDGVLVARHPPIEGRGGSRVDPAHRRPRIGGNGARPAEDPPVIQGVGGAVARRSLNFYEAVARRLATGSEQAR
jgi:hypothetical protein